MKKPKLFISYSHADEFYKEELEKHLATMKRNQEVEIWNDRILTPGEEWDKIINTELLSADIILFLVSSDFIASDYCNDIEVKKAVEKHDLETAKVIPIIIRACDWQSTLFSKIRVLPKDAKPIKKWIDLDEAFLNVAEGIRRMIKGNTIVSETNPKDTDELAFEIMDTETKKIKLFISYAHVDKNIIETFENIYFKAIQNHYDENLEAWTDKGIKAGTNWDNKIKNEIDTADVILFFISNAFLASDYIKKTEIANALERFKEKKQIIVPIYIEEVLKIMFPFADKQYLPGVKPLKRWNNRNDAWIKIQEGLITIINDIRSGKSMEYF